MATKHHGRRAAETKVKTPLTELTELLNANSAVFGRRAAVVAASGGLLTAAVLPAAGQAGDDNVAVSADSKTQVAEFQNQAATVVADGSAKDKKDDSSFSVDVQTVTAKPAPKPEPKPKSSAAASSDSDSSKSSSKSKSDKGASKDSGSGDVKIPDGSKAQQVLAIAKQYVGTPYVSGGTSPSGWDCSGFTSYVYAKVGVNLPRTSGAQGSAGATVSKSEAKPGDLIWKPGHIGIYAGNGMMYDAGNPRVDTSYRSIDWMIAGGAKFVRVL
ncbi:C40 family peptidase [Brevibacterium metallidurans]|uniref:NlpC/P60 domain-containing protein n=1 Tax=Brevibacterium metallidurans TaxID=1482676 RepID=A0ABN0SMC5_9MICO